MKCRVHKYYNYKGFAFFFLSNTSLHPSLFMEHWKMLERDKHLDIFDFCSPEFTNPKRTINCHPTKYDSNSSGLFKGPLGHIWVNGDSGSWENTNEAVTDAENGLTWLWLPWKPIFLIYGFFFLLFPKLLIVIIWPVIKKDKEWAMWTQARNERWGWGK